jgi:hypothetical protein
MAALFAYADEHEAAGDLWPARRHFYTETGKYDGYENVDWRRELMGSLATVLAVRP